MKFAPSLIAALIAISPLALAQSGTAQHGAHAAPVQAPAQGTGTLKKVDVAAGVITIDHGPIPSLNWPAMTMDMKVRDKALLKNFKAGQAVTFSLERAGNEYVITGMTAAK